MSSPAQADEDEVEEEVEFVSEGPLRPVLDCIDLLSDSEDEGCSSLTGALEDKLSRHKARVTSTLDRLAHQVALEKKERADKCKAFKEKQNLQRAHGQQELAFSSSNGVNQDAKRCVDMWLKMPGLQPGTIASGSGRRHRPASFPRSASTRHTCPVINCGRVYENASLLDGHLKRFDHSPCDPAIHLKGSPSELFACVACGQHFPTKGAWREHLESKVSSSAAADAHSATQACQRIACFACPACYLLFSLRDECLQHMSAKDHFTEALAMNEPRGRALPVPVPQYVKNCLIALCKDTTFNVRCSLCHKVLVSHQAAQAHFNVHCRQGCAVAKAEKTIAQVMRQLQVRGQCPLCCKLFLSQAEMERHRESTQHDVEVNRTMGRALLQHCRFGEIQHSHGAREAPGKRRPHGLEAPFQKRNRRQSDFEDAPAKRHRPGPRVNGGPRRPATAWYCECGASFAEEAAATRHLLAVNQIFHQCGVCGKHMGEASITRLHMSRFHGGAHLSNFLFYCRKCKVEMPRYEDILSHVSDAHSGHAYFAEREVPEEAAAAPDAKPSTSDGAARAASSKPQVQHDAVESSSSSPSSSRAERSWMCRMCEDVFDSEAAVREHCADAGGHSFQRFVCGHCPQKFFKESTVRRHCANEHGGRMSSAHFCGLCDSMRFGSEGEFLEHYRSLHSEDFFCVDGAEVVQAAAGGGAGRPACPCMGAAKRKGEMKAVYTQCMRDLAAEGKCRYACAPCGVSLPSYALMKTHVHTRHAALNLDTTFAVECGACRESFAAVPRFHDHYHSRHCALDPCASARTCHRDTEAAPAAGKTPGAVEIRPDDSESEGETPVKVLNVSQADKETEANENDSDNEMKHALTLIEEDEARERRRESAELEEALQRSLLEF